MTTVPISKAIIKQVQVRNVSTKRPHPKIPTNPSPKSPPRQIHAPKKQSSIQNHVLDGACLTSSTTKEKLKVEIFKT